VHDKQDHVTVRGTQAAIDKARAALEELVATYEREHVERSVSRLEFQLVAGGTKTSSQLDALKEKAGLRSLRGAAPYATNPGRLYLEGPQEAIAAANAEIDRILVRGEKCGDKCRHTHGLLQEGRQRERLIGGAILMARSSPLCAGPVAQH
jgi:hypothetical protein